MQASRTARWSGWRRAAQHREAVFHALAVAHENLVEAEVDVLHAEAQALHQAHARAVEKRGDEARAAVEPREDGPHLFTGEDDGQAFGAFGAHDVAEGLDGPPEDFAVKEQERAQGLGLGGGGDAAARGEVRNEGVDLGLAHLVGMLPLAAWGLLLMEKVVLPKA